MRLYKTSTRVAIFSDAYNDDLRSSVVLQGPVHLLDVGKDDLGIQPPRADHVVHVVARNEIGNAGKPSKHGARGSKAGDVSFGPGSDCP